MIEGESTLNASQGRHRKSVYRPISSHAFEVTVRDQSPGDATEWTTGIRIVADGELVHVLIENRMESDDLTRRVSVGRPRVVHDLLGAAGKPCLGGNSLLTEPLSVPGAGIEVLTDLLADPNRTLPVIVCSEPGGYHDGSWLRSVNKIASRVEGIAVVVTLDGNAVTAFKEVLGDLAIWGGGIRVYAPAAVVAGADGWRHRFYVRSRLEEAPQATIDRIVYSVAQLSARRRVPEVFRVFGEQSGLPAGVLDGTIPVAELEVAREQWEFDFELALEERSELVKELSRANGHLARLKDELNARGFSDLIWGTQHGTDASVPDEVQDTSEAVLAAQMYLSKWLVVPELASRELADIDTAPTAFAWGNNAWRGLRALAAYAEDRSRGWDKGGFWEWCASGPVLGWPATSKKLSMTESESVKNNDKLARARVFKVDTEVDASGAITMLAHLKISEGGGNLAPRIYFYDDTNGSTQKVHVGLVGPHYLVPNKSTN
ncbi:hypothetical protein DEJ38_08760 [Kocuria rosea]|nr:hypothetical protein DEQ16_15795 [Dietzia maris]PWF81858.1 hypothetical protein DEJ38_08760 [Kocuria rosea]